MQPLPSALGALLGLLIFAPRIAHADGPVPLHIETSGDELEVFDRTNDVAMVPVRVGRYGTALERSYVFAPLCAHTPCEAYLAPGRHHLAVSEPGGHLVQGDEALDVGSPATLTWTYADRSGWRLGGLALMLVSAGVGAGLFYASAGTKTECTPGSPATAAGPGTWITGTTSNGGTVSGYVPQPGSPATSGSCASVRTFDPGLAAGGAGVLLGGLVAGLVMMAQSDSASFKITPITLSSLSPHREGVLDAMPNGLALTMRF
jgi:hypothetical protein